MAPRQKKEEEKGELLVSVEQFTRTRDQVIVALTNLQTGLTHVQNGLNDLLRAYMTHTTSILSGEGGTIENLQLPPNIAANATAAAEAAQTAGSAIAHAIIAPLPGAPAPAAAADGKKKRKREKKTRDPNAPKRPLTAAFLYAQTARPIVKVDLENELEEGQKLEPNAVNIEVTKRWNEMTDAAKETWRQSYRVSMEQWKKDAEIYKISGLAAAFAAEAGEEDHSDEAEGGAIDTDVEVESDDEEEAVVAKEATPPATKTPRPNKRQKTAQVNGTNHVAIAPASGTSPSKQTPILPPGSATEASAPPTSTKKDSRKKKAAPQPIAPAPVAQPEPTPEDTKKKPKSTRATRNTEVEVETPVAEKVTKKRDRSKRKSEATTA